ncbi:MAG TPA: SDR family oxidoreductase [Mycobacteriales bacterium]|nr:SDR family oxidoreductase [Mycobacteriales bacterium]
MISSGESLSLHDRVAIVTGGSSEFGGNIARTLASAGATVAVAARRVDRLQQLAADVPGLLPIACDVADDTALERLVSTAHRELGPIDILVNGAGVFGDAVPAERMSRASFEEVLGVNLLAPMRLSSLVFPDMRERGSGSIINVASISGLVGMGRIPQAAYVASKSGLVGLTRELALQWARYGIRVNAIAPGFFASEMTAPGLAVQKVADWITGNTPLRRLALPQEFAAPLLLLASDAGSYMTGQTLIVDGGWTAR